MSQKWKLSGRLLCPCGGGEEIPLALTCHSRGNHTAIYKDLDFLEENEKFLFIKGFNVYSCY